jgi:hypothetical protein
MLFTVSSLVYSEEVSIDTFADTYIRLTSAIDKLKFRSDTQSYDLVRKGKERLSYYEAFLQKADKGTIKQLVKESFEQEILLNQTENGKNYIEYAQKLTTRLIFMYTQDVGSIFAQYNLSPDTAKRQIIINRDNINTESILKNIDSIKYPFPFGEVELMPDADRWITKGINISSDFSNTLESKLTSYFAGQELINKVKQNISLWDSSGMSPRVDNIIIVRPENRPVAGIQYTATLHPDKGGQDVKKYYKGEALVLTIIVKNDSAWTTKARIDSVTMPVREVFVDCPYCQGKRYTEFRRVTRSQFQEMNEQYASPDLSQMHTEGIEIELPWQIVKRESEYVFVIGYKCKSCNGSGGKIQTVRDSNNSELETLKRYIRNNFDTF